jgi:hypothetical protein
LVAVKDERDARFIKGFSLNYRRVHFFATPGIRIKAFLQVIKLQSMARISR